MEEKIWEKSVTGNQLLYAGTVEGILYDAPPSFRPTLEVDELALISIGHNMQNEIATWTYQGTEESVRLWCSYPASASVGRQMNDETAIENAQTLAIGDNTATYYLDKEHSILVWENADGLLFFLSGKNISQELLVEIAQSIKPITDTVDAHDLNWMPSGYSLMEWYEIADTVQEYWIKDNVALSWMYAMDALGTPDWDSTTVDVNGVDAQYWEAQDTYYTDSASGDNDSIPGISITSYTKPAQREMNTLAWQDPHTGVHYRLQSILPQDEMLRMANSVD